MSTSALIVMVIGAACLIQANAQFYQHQFDDTEAEEQSQEAIFEEEQPHVRARRQLFGGVSHGFGGSRSQSVGYQAGPAWGSLSQSSNSRGFTSPITYSGGLGGLSAAGHGASGRIDTQPGIGSHVNVRGQLGLVNTPNHQVTAWAQHDRNLDKNFRVVGRETNSAGLNYLNKNSGATAFASGSHTPGAPDRGSVGGSIPIATGNGGRTRLEATGQTDFGKGMKPQHQVGVQLTHDF